MQEGLNIVHIQHILYTVHILHFKSFIYLMWFEDAMHVNITPDRRLQSSSSGGKSDDT